MKKLAILLLSSLAFTACKKSESTTETPVAKQWLTTQIVETYYQYDGKYDPNTGKVTYTLSSTNPQTTVYTYNADKKIESGKFTNGTGSTTKKFTYSTNKIDALLDYPTGGSSKIEYTLDEKGRITVEKTSDKEKGVADFTLSNTTTYTYNADGYLTKKVEKDSNSETVSDYTYADGNPTRVNSTYAYDFGDALPGNLQYSHPVTYLDYGTLNYGKVPAKLVTKGYYVNPDTKVKSLSYTLDYTKDTNGNIIKVVETDDRGVVRVTNYTYAQF